MRYLAVDFGERRIGIAISDPEGKIAFPHSARERTGHKRDCATIVDLLRGLGAEVVVVGLPRSLDGAREGQSEAAVRSFGAALQRCLLDSGVAAPLEWWDERFSTSEALGGLREAGISQRAAREAGDARSVDARAAAVILQGFLDSERCRTLDDAVHGGEGPEC